MAHSMLSLHKTGPCVRTMTQIELNSVFSMAAGDEMILECQDVVAGSRSEVLPTRRLYASPAHRFSQNIYKACDAVRKCSCVPPVTKGSIFAKSPVAFQPLISTPNAERTMCLVPNLQTQGSQGVHQTAILEVLQSGLRIARRICIWLA